MIDFNKIEEQKIPNMRGGEGTARVKKFTDGSVNIMQITLEEGCSIGLHTHTDDFEAIYAVAGEAVYTLNGEEERIRAGQCHYCPQGSSHSVKNYEKDPFVMFAVVGKRKA